MKNVMVLIADIVNSRSIENRQQSQRNLKAIINSVNTHSIESLLSPITLTLGDKFRKLMNTLKMADHTIIEITTTELFNPDLTNLCLRLLSKEIATHHLKEYTEMLIIVADDLITGLEIDIGLLKNGCYTFFRGGNDVDHVAINNRSA